MVQNDATALELAHHDYQNQLRGHINTYSLAAAAVPDDQLPSFYQHQASAASVALQQYTDATGYQFQPPNPQAPSSVTQNILAPHIAATLPPHPQPTRSTLHFSNLEPWMDVEYFNKLAGMMNWQNIILKIPSTPSNEGVGSLLVPNNPGYCFMTFPTPAFATAVLKSLTEGDMPKVMPNSKRPFVVTWATIPASSARTNVQRSDPFGNDASVSGLFALGNLSVLNLHTPPTVDDLTSQPNNRQQEFSIFVGDLAPETTNSDLIAVFRDPILGLRHDREPKFVAPFLSCKSAKIMVDPVMGVSKGYGFVRFGTPTDASRALIEMQGLYCLSRPMRISQATAKARAHGYAPQSAAPASSFGTPPPHPFTPPFDYDFHGSGSDRGSGSTVTSPSAVHPANGVSRAFIVGHQKVATSPTGSASSVHSLQEAQRAASRRGDGGPESDPLDSLPSETLDALSTLNIDRSTLSQLLKMAMVKPSAEQDENEDIRASSDPLSAPAAIRHFGQSDGLAHRASMSGPVPVHTPNRSYSQSMNGTSAHSPVTSRNMVPPSSGADASQTSQAKSLVASMMGNNASVLNSSDPYNTTVFVGGLSGLISEDTLRTFFGPFGEIHYVKIPPGKGCGFVQFVRKADAEAAISKMQGFPIGGGRVRLSWGRSQYKAAQAAAQVARLSTGINDSGDLQGLSETQTAQILQACGVSNAGSNTFSRHQGSSELQNPHTFSPEAAYGVEGTGNLDQYDIRAVSGPHSVIPVQNDLANANLSRSHTFPTFTTFNGEPSNFSPPSNVSASRSVAGLNARSQYVNTYGPGSAAVYADLIATRGNISQRDLEAMESGHMVDPYSDGAHGIYPNRGPVPFPANEVIRQERSGSGSTIATTASDKTPPLQPMKNDFLDLADNFAALNFGQNPAFGAYPAYHLAEAKGMLSSAFGPYLSDNTPTGQHS